MKLRQLFTVLLILIGCLLLLSAYWLAQAALTDHQIDVQVLGWSFHMQPGWGNWVFCGWGDIDCHNNPFGYPVPK